MDPVPLMTSEMDSSTTKEVRSTAVDGTTAAENKNSWKISSPPSSTVESPPPTYSDVTAARTVATHQKNGNVIGEKNQENNVDMDDERKESIMTNDSMSVTDGNCKVSLIPESNHQGGIEPTDEPVEREQWGRKLEFLLSVIGFAVDLGNVWRFPYICFKNGGGAFLIPYIIMVLCGGVPMFYLELLIGQYHRSGCISIWKKICPMFKGVGYSICVMALYVSFYYNTIIAWSVYYLYSSLSTSLPWADCNHEWADERCYNPLDNITHLNSTAKRDTQLPAQQFFERHVLELHKSTGLNDLGVPRWQIVICLFLVFIMLYFTLWKGVRSSGKVVWVTATFPYMVLLVLLIRGCTLPGASKGIKFYLTPDWAQITKTTVWFDAATQVFFSLGPGFGTLIALSSYNRFDNNCHRDAILTSVVNCLTSFIAGFVVFSVLGYMAVAQDKDVKDVATQGPGLLFVVYGQAMTQFGGSTVFSIIFFSMLITLGLDSSFGGLEAVITAFCDEFPNKVGKRRELFVFLFLSASFLGALVTTTQGGMYVLTLLEIYATGPAIMTVVLIEAVALSWIYGMKRLCGDVKEMLSFSPGIFWVSTWAYISPLFLLVMITMSVAFPPPLEYGDHKFVDWATSLGWCITMSSMSITPIYMLYAYCTAHGSFKQRWHQISQPQEVERRTVLNAECLQMGEFPE